MSKSSLDLPPEPGTISDPELGIPGDPVPLPDDDADGHEATCINDEDDD